MATKLARSYFQPHSGMLACCECGFSPVGSCDECEVNTLSYASCEDDALTDVCCGEWELFDDGTLFCGPCVRNGCSDMREGVNDDN